MTLPLTREARIYSAIWRKAEAQYPKPLVIKFPTSAAAHSFRRAMYRFLAPYRRNPTLDTMLACVSETIAISNVKPDFSLELCPKVSTAAADHAMMELLLDESDLLSDMEKELMKEKAPDPAPPVADNPFYRRDER